MLEITLNLTVGQMVVYQGKTWKIAAIHDGGKGIRLEAIVGLYIGDIATTALEDLILAGKLQFFGGIAV